MTTAGVVGVDGKTFRSALGRHAAGVVVVTGPDGPAGPCGFTASSFTSVSMCPPLVSFCIDRCSGTWPALRAAGTFAVNVLGEDQHDVAERFARHGFDRFAPPTRWHHGPGGLPLLEGALTHLVCLSHTEVELGDHWLVVGLVVAVYESESNAPLLYHRGHFGRFRPVARPRLDQPSRPVDEAVNRS